MITKKLFLLETLNSKVLITRFKDIKPFLQLIRNCILVGTTTSGKLQKTIQSIDSIDSSLLIKEDAPLTKSLLPVLKQFKMKMILTLAQ